MKICEGLIEEALCDATRPALTKVQKTGCSYLKELTLSSIFIEKKKNYGTRTSTVVLVDRENKVTFMERTHLHEPERNYIMRILFPRVRVKGKIDRCFEFTIGEE